MTSIATYLIAQPGLLDQVIAVQPVMSEETKILEELVLSQQRLVMLRYKRAKIAVGQRRRRGQMPIGGRINLHQLELDSYKTYFRYMMFNLLIVFIELTDNRFSKDEIYRLIHVLRLPPRIKCDNRIVEDSFTAMCMLLRRFAFTARAADLYLEFGWKPERLSRVVNTTTEMIYTRWRKLLSFDHTRLSPERLQLFANAMEERGCPLHGCWGFIDGTQRPICRPVINQNAVYNGHHREHSLGYQGVVTPDSLLQHVFGPLPGNAHDKRILDESELLLQLSAYSHGPLGNDLCIYGDAGYNTSQYLVAPYQGSVLLPHELAFNSAMSRVRIIAEWSFKEVTMQFKFLTDKLEQKLLLQPVGMQFLVCILLHNAHVCLHYPQILQYFEETMHQYIVQPPSLENIFAFLMNK